MTTFLFLGMGSATAMAGPAVLSNDDLAEVVGQEGISMVLHLQVNTSDAGSQALGASFTHSFNVNGTTTYATAQGLKGVIDLVGLTIDVAPRPDLAGGSYIDIGLPGVSNLEDAELPAFLRRNIRSLNSVPSLSETVAKYAERR